MNDLLILAHEILCAVMFYTVFCRAVKSNYRVRADVRLAFVLLGVVASAGMAAPIAWRFVPDPFSLTLLFAMTVVQVVTAHHWAGGVPEIFYKPECTPRLRRASDKIGRLNHG